MTTSRRQLIDDASGAVPITPLARGELDGWLASAAPAARRWVSAMGFAGDAGGVCLLPDADGKIDRVLLGLGEARGPWDWAAAAERLPAGAYRIDAPLDAMASEQAALGWALACYRFARYRTERRQEPADTAPADTAPADTAPAGATPQLVWPQGVDRARVERAVDASWLARDLINTPAGELGPEELAGAVCDVGRRFGAQASVIVGDDLLAHNYPLIHAVGRASSRQPRLVDLLWGDPEHPKVTLIGKGVCFDSGGLDLKPASAMKLMKKDMGGAAIALGAAQMLMAAGLPIRLRLLIPAVENSVSGNALRPLDVVRSRSGRSVEIGNTDAEGRLILADALTEAAGERPSLLADCATLTGAARVAVGTEVSALFTNDDGLADALLASGRKTADPLWRLPLWAPYRRHLDSKVADVNSAPDHAYAGAVLAALFLEDFVRPAVPWLHLDVMAWNLSDRPGRPKGGEPMGMRALADLIETRFGAGC